jgi:hypothetical protein
VTFLPFVIVLSVAASSWFEGLAGRRAGLIRLSRSVNTMTNEEPAM